MIDAIRKFTVKAIVGIVLSIMLLITITLLVEQTNIKQNSLNLFFEINQAMKMACDYFEQETYRGGGSKEGNAFDLKGLNNDVIVSGQFYRGSAQDTYKELYFYNPDFQSYVYELKSEVPEIENDIRFTIMEEIAEGRGDMESQMITPANLGLTYLDKNKLRNIFRWMLANMLSSPTVKSNIGDGVANSTRYNIMKDPGNTKGEYINWNGFRIYLNDIDVWVKYEVVDLLEGDLDDFMKKTHLLNIRDYVSRMEIEENDMRRYKVIATIYYKIGVGYEGILPISKLYEMFIKNDGMKTLTDMDNIAVEDTIFNSHNGNREFTHTVLTNDPGLGYTDENDIRLWKDIYFCLFE